MMRPMNRPSTGPLALTESQLAAALGTLAEAVTVQSADGRVLFANRAALQMLGFSSLEDMLDADPAAVLAAYRYFRADGTPMALEELPGRRVLLGERPQPVLVRWMRMATDELRYSVIKASPLHDDDGNLVGAVNVIEDVTEATEADMARRLLDQAARRLSSSLDYEQTLQEVARLAVPILADWCAVDLVDRRGEIEQVAVAHVDPARVSYARELRRRYPISPDDPDGVPFVIREGETALVQDVSDEMLVAAARDEEHLEQLRALGLRAGLVVPLEVAGRVIGALTLVLTGENRRFTPGDVALAEELGRRAGAAVHAARLFTERGEISHVLQASLLPGELPAVPGYEHALHHVAAGEANEVGGDLYDIQPAGENRWLLLVGDVVGKGATAAALTPRVRHTIATATSLTGDPRDGLRLLDRALDREPEPDRSACTIAAVVLEGAHASVISAGHPRPLLVRGRAVTEIDVGGRMLGVQDGDTERPVVELDLEVGDALVLYTDGISEAPGPDDRFGTERMAEALIAAGPGASAQELVDALREAVDAFAGRGARDDVVVLVVRRTG
jgi:serine phosphatase RsbU (regulator of sigma subunit)